MMRLHKSAPPSIPGVLDWDEGRDLWAVQGCPAEDVSQSAHWALLDRVFGSLHNDWWEIWFGICDLNIKKFILQDKQDLVWKRTLNKMKLQCPQFWNQQSKFWGYLQKMFNYRPGHNRPERWLLLSEQWTTIWTNTTSYSVLWWPDDNNLSPNCYKSVVQLLKLSLVLSLSYRQRFPQPYLLEVIKGGILNSSHPCIVFLHFEFWFWLIWPYYSNIINWNKSLLLGAIVLIGMKYEL